MGNNFGEGFNLKNIAILGSTGSIGTQALEVVRQNPERFKVFVLTANNNAELLIRQALEFNPAYVVLTSESKLAEVRNALSSSETKVLFGLDELCEVLSHPEISLVLTAMVGFAGLIPTLAAIKAGKDIALANKETLVVAGELVNSLAKEYGVKILPVDSEHSAIFQCLAGEERNPIEKIYLTASGGPFRGRDADFLATISRKEALKHPNWVMGEKITIDSASLMNKGLEVIEAKWLFDLDVSQIDVIVHPQSIVHSIVQFRDGSMKAQMGLPDMKLPIQYALAYPERIENTFPRFNFLDYPNLSFEQADKKTFRNLALAFEALKAGGNMPCVINAANEVVVAEFLNNRLGFLQMSDVIERCMSEISFIADPLLDDYMETDRITRIYAQELVTNNKY
ncbi:1-deoxy-D-xylulose-5-phosphate reductoisomerase [Daejeonella rubra]|uniref:1-deoxy-D-xylulose 5-phosphate reductoisomerase n=1 Tax=Daejeonella rubra TaxID=990371 RepID=A0A1G9N0H6_9SPHI|nr:1-deoxy-D-xylulose-5-phosphate reductoisomerase [Daejeonella rubra]SDL79854.1 1-deoxy-D-xylulose-5-phosphate reductoisomerase [Daejeonella rubra]